MTKRSHGDEIRPVDDASDLWGQYRRMTRTSAPASQDGTVLVKWTLYSLNCPLVVVEHPFAEADYLCRNKMVPWDDLMFEEMEDALGVAIRQAIPHMSGIKYPLRFTIADSGPPYLMRIYDDALP